LNVRQVQDRFENDPKFQIVFNKFFTYFWLVNIVVASIIFFSDRKDWDKYSIFYVTVISLYANFATNYGALSASESSEAAKEAAEHASVMREAIPIVPSVGEE